MAGSKRQFMGDKEIIDRKYEHKFKTNTFAKKYKAKNEALERARGAKEAIPERERRDYKHR